MSFLGCGESSSTGLGEFVSDSSSCPQAAYYCSEGSLREANWVETGVDTTQAFQDVCAPNKISDVCFGSSVEIKSAPAKKAISSSNLEEMCSAVEFSAAAYMCENAFKKYKSLNPARLLSGAVQAVYHNEDLTVPNPLCAVVPSSLCPKDFPLNLQYFVVDNVDESWISIRGTVLSRKGEPDFANGILDLYSAFTDKTIELKDGGAVTESFPAGNTIFQSSALQNIKIHSGFLAYTEGLFHSLEVNNYISKNKAIKITGHSLGAGASIILALMLKDRGYLVDAVYNFGQPTVTNIDGANLLNSFLEGNNFLTDSNYIRFINQLDPIPFGLWTINDGGAPLFAHFGPEMRIGLGDSFCAAGLDIGTTATKCYSPTELDKNKSFAYVSRDPALKYGTLGYPEITVKNAASEHDIAVYMHRMEQLGCTGFEKIKQVREENCLAYISDSTSSPSAPETCVKKVTCN